MMISVVGGGYVGIVSSVCFAQLGHCVNLIEIDRKKAAAINQGIPPIYEEGLEDMLSRHAGHGLKATTSYESISASDISFICVGTPAKPDGSADLSMVEAASRSIGACLKGCDGYHVVAVKSTVPPGTTQNLVIPNVIRESGLTFQSVGFVMNPEFLREGLAVQDFMSPDRIVIGSNDTRAGDVGQAVYRGLRAPVVRTGLMAAEMIKYASNAFLATKISFSNEIGNLCKVLGIDVYEVMAGVGLDHRISPHFLNAGAGFGGSCFPKDVSALIHLSKGAGIDPVLLRAAMKVNDLQPQRMVQILKDRIPDLKGKKVTVLGLAFKDGTDDIRESRAIPVIKTLLDEGAVVSAYDPRAGEAMASEFPGIEYHKSASDALIDADACLVMTEWPEFSKLEEEFDLMRSKVIIEGRRILKCRDDVEGICW